MKKLMFAAALLGVAVGAGLAQEIRVNKQIFGTPHGEFVLPTFDVITANGAIDIKQIKNAPFAAEFASESVQILADNNRIVRGSTTSVYRDSEGRTRREQALNLLGGALPSGAGVGRQIFIYDPVAKSNYTLSPFARTAFRAKIFSVTVNANSAPSKSDQLAFERSAIKIDPKIQAEMKRQLEQLSKNGENRVFPETREESLGTRDIENVAADGKRVTTVLPAGFIGNEKPIEIVRETWFSKELGMIVFSQTKNPLTGEQTYKLVKLIRGEQPRQLFEVPADYKIVDGANLLNRLTDAPPVYGETWTPPTYSSPDAGY